MIESQKTPQNLNILKDFLNQGNTLESLKKLIEPDNINLKTRFTQKQVRFIAKTNFLELSKPDNSIYPFPLDALDITVEHCKQMFVSYKGVSREQIVKGIQGTQIRHNETSMQNQDK